MGVRTKGGEFAAGGGNVGETKVEKKNKIKEWMKRRSSTSRRVEEDMSSA